MDFSVIDRSGLTQQQFADLAGVSRITVNTWVRGKFRPRGAPRERVIKIIRSLEDALELDLLPVAILGRREATEAVLAELLPEFMPARAEA